MAIRVVIHPSYEWPGSARNTKITHRELEVLSLVVSGINNRQITEMLGTKYQSVKNHLYHITKKLGASNNTQALFKALDLNIVRLDMRPKDSDVDFDEKEHWTLFRGKGQSAN